VERSHTGEREATPGAVIGWLLRAAAYVSVTQARELRATSLSPSAFNVLLELADAPDQMLQPCVLADRLAVSRPSMCGLIDGLQAKGLVTRAPHHHDGRRVLVGLSAAGQRLLDGHRARYDATLDALLTDLASSDRQRLLRLLQRIGA
jgi:DNA-binding MarR family transcriptional regulator